MPRSDPTTLVSVIIPTYNRSGLLRLTVESVLSQTYPNIEIVVVDDGSTDDTAEVLAQFSDRITYVFQPHQGGGGRATGLREAHGAYVSFLDHDDLLAPTKIERQVRILDTRAEIGLVHCGYFLIDKDGERLEKVNFLPEGQVLGSLLLGSPIWSGGPLIRRTCLDEVGLGSGGCGDTDTWVRIALAGYPFACVQAPLGAYRVMPGTQMSNVERVSKGTFSVLDRVFADPRTSDEVLALKSQAYGAMHFWTSCRYYAAGGPWDAAQHHLSEAMALTPELLQPPEQLVQGLSEEALNIRVDDPLRFATDVLDHLPASALALKEHSAQLLGQVRARLALRHYAWGRIREATRQLGEALTSSPAIWAEPGGFRDMVASYAMRQPGEDPIAYVQTVFDNLPVGATELASVRSSVLDRVHLGCAFEAYHAECPRQALRHLSGPLRRHPSWLLDAGAASVLFRSLAALLTQRAGPPYCPRGRHA